MPSNHCVSSHDPPARKKNRLRGKALPRVRANNNEPWGLKSSFSWCFCSRQFRVLWHHGRSYSCFPRTGSGTVAGCPKLKANGKFISRCPGQPSLHRACQLQPWTDLIPTTCPYRPPTECGECRISLQPMQAAGGGLESETTMSENWHLQDRGQPVPKEASCPRPSALYQFSSLLLS